MATEWYVKCNPELNEQVAAWLIEHGYAEAETKRIGMLCRDGKRRDVWLIPGNAVRPFMKLVRANRHFELEVYTRSSPGAVLQPANFLKVRKPDNKIDDMRRQLEKITRKA